MPSYPETTAPEAADYRVARLSQLEKLLLTASDHRDALDRILDEACVITGEDRANSFTNEAVWDGRLTAEELLRSVKAGHYVRSETNAE